MLAEIRIQSLGAISTATAEFDRGLTVLTGETGTGKTMVVTGLHLLGGARADTTRVRSGADRAVVELTATGSASRIDDETAGLPLTSTARGASAGTLVVPRACYICKNKYVQVDVFYHQLCPDCAAMSHAKRDARTDLIGRRALLTGGRAKIGMYIALRLLRDGADLTITTRFPRDAVRRFASLPDSSDWLHRLRVVGIDLRDPAQVVALADDVASLIHPHPTQSEALGEAHLALAGKPLHAL